MSPRLCSGTWTISSNIFSRDLSSNSLMISSKSTCKDIPRYSSQCSPGIITEISSEISLEFALGISPGIPPGIAPGILQKILHEFLCGFFQDLFRNSSRNSPIIQITLRISPRITYKNCLQGFFYENLFMDFSRDFYRNVCMDSST